MLVAPLPKNEHERLDALYALRLLDTSPEDRFDSITHLAADIFDVPMAFVSLIDRDRQWMKSKVGLSVCETSRELSFCSHAILGEDVLIIPDTHQDPRFADNPLVTGDPYLRFYAGQPLRAPGGEKIGTLCIADRQAHDFGSKEMQLFRRLATLLERELRMGDLIELQTDLLGTQEELLKTQKHLWAELSAAAKYVASLIPSPMEAPVSIDWKFIPSAELGGDCIGYHYLDENRVALYLLDVCGHGVGAALLSVALLSSLRSQGLVAVDFSQPSSVLSALNREFPIRRHGRFFTIWYGVLELKSRRLIYSSGGHPPALLISPSGRMTRLTTNGIAVGCVPHSKYEDAECVLEPGDTLYIFSDGAYELRSGGEDLLSLDTFEALLAESVADPTSSLALLVEELRRINGRTQFSDDVTLLQVSLPFAGE